MFFKTSLIKCKSFYKIYLMSLLPAADRHVTLIDGYIEQGQRRYRTMWAVHAHPWTFNSEITQTIRNNSRQLRNMIANLEKKLQNQSSLENDYNGKKEDLELVIKNRDFFKNRCTELQSQLASSKSQLSQALKDSQLYRNSWYVAAQRIKKQSSQQSTYKAEIQRLSTQCNINFNAYKKELQMKEKISKDYNVNISYYQNQLSKKQAGLKAENEKETAKVNELQWTIIDLNGKIKDLENWKEINYNAYTTQDSLRKQVVEENQALTAKNNELWAKLTQFEQQVKKQQDEIYVLKLQVQLMTKGYAELYLQLNSAETQLTVANIPISYKSEVAIEIKEEETAELPKEGEQPKEQSSEVYILKTGQKLISQDYAALYLRTMYAEDKNKKIETEIQQLKQKEIQIEGLRQENKDYIQNIANLESQIKKNQEQYNSQKEKNSLQVGKVLGYSTKMIRWLYEPTKSWTTVFNEFVTESSLYMNPKAIISISVILCHSDGRAAVKAYYDDECDEKPNQNSQVSYKMVRTKVNVGDQLMYKSYTEHETRLWQAICELKEKGARIISGSDLEVNLGHEDNLSVIWYEIAQS